jgi:probable F420-dependent oxidoreductase
VRFGLTTPVLTLVPRRHAPWEAAAGVGEIRRMAETADRFGYHYLTCSEHVAIPVEVAKQRGGRYYDPYATLGFIAALTQRIRLVTHVLVLPYHHPLEVAKRIGTLDQLSGGRVVCGVGVGSLREEFELLGVDFEGRGRRYEDALRALRAALGQREPTYHGSHFSFSGFVVDPCAMQARVPIWLGGRTPRSLRRALAFADGWDPFGFTHAKLAALLQRAQRWPEWQPRSTPFELVFTPDRLIDVSTADQIPDVIEQVAAYQCIGATVLNLQFRHTSLQHYLDQLETFMMKVAPLFGGSAVP